MWRNWAGVAAAVFLLAVETPVIVRCIEMQWKRESRLAPPFQVKIFEPVIASWEPKGVGLYWSDRVLEIEGHPVRNRADIEDGLRDAMAPGGRVRLRVRHYPEDSEPWDEEALGYFPAAGEGNLAKFPQLWSTAVFSAVVWPSICLLLGAAVLASNGRSPRAWLAGMTLAGIGHFHWMVVTPYSWGEPWRTVMVIFDAAVSGAGPVGLFAMMCFWPVPILRDRGDAAARWLWAVGGGWVVLRVLVRLAELTDYRLLAPWTWLDGVMGSGTYALVMIAGVGLAIRWGFGGGRDLTVSELGRMKGLQRGVWSFLGGLGVLTVFVPWLTGDLMGVLTMQPLVWICYLASLGVPLSMAWVGAQKELTVDELDLKPPEFSDAAGLLAWVRLIANEKLGVEVLALYGPVAGELRVLAAAVRGHDWKPLRAGEAPPDGILHWEAFAEGTGYLCAAPGLTPWEGSQRDGLRRLAAAVSQKLETHPTAAAISQS